jgi:hypothetical protein
LVNEPAVRAGLDSPDTQAIRASVIQEWHQQNGNPAPNPRHNDPLKPALSYPACTPTTGAPDRSAPHSPQRLEPQLTISSGSFTSGIVDPGSPGCLPDRRPEKPREESHANLRTANPTTMATRDRRISTQPPLQLHVPSR